MVRANTFQTTSWADYRIKTNTSGASNPRSWSTSRSLSKNWCVGPVARSRMATGSHRSLTRKANVKEPGIANRPFETCTDPLSNSACLAPRHGQPKAPAPSCSSPRRVPGPSFPRYESLGR